MQWEQTGEYNLGLDIALFKNRIGITFDYYYAITKSLLYEKTVNSVSGYNKAWTNEGKLRNKGFEVELTTYNFNGRKFKWNTSFNVSVTRNRLLDLGGPAEQITAGNYKQYYIARVGEPLIQFYGYKTVGVWKTQEEINNNPHHVSDRPGGLRVANTNGDGVINDGDKVAIGATTKPNLIYGFGISAQWKGFDFNVHFQGAGKSSFFINGSTVFAFKDSQWGNVLGNLVANRWVDADTAAKLGIPANEDPNASYPRLSYGGNDNNQQKSTFWLKNGSYLRLKTLEVGYTLPKSIVNKIKFNNIRVFFIGTNLLTFAKFKEWDPELGSSTGAEYPLSRVMTLGLTVNI